jgi:hypothetical protein
LKKTLGVAVVITMTVLALTTAVQANPEPTEDDALCRGFFAVQKCISLESEWKSFVDSPSQEGVREFAELLLPSSDEQIPCEGIFSEQVCALLHEVWVTIEDTAGNPGGTIDEVRRIVIGVLDEVVKIIVCTLDPSHPMCTAPLDSTTTNLFVTTSTVSQTATDPCREVFSDQVCDTIENPGPLVAQWIAFIYSQVRCYIDPDCSPLDDLICPMIEPCPLARE